MLLFLKIQLLFSIGLLKNTKRALKIPLNIVQKDVARCSPRLAYALGGGVPPSLGGRRSPRQPMAEAEVRMGAAEAGMGVVAEEEVGDGRAAEVRTGDGG